MSTKTMKITPEVRMDSKYQYLIRIDGEEMAFADSSKEALLIVDSVAAAEQKRLETEWTKVFRQDLDDGRKVVISTQALGYVANGSITKAVTIDFVTVGHAFLVKGRHELNQDDEESVPEPPSVPVPDILQMLAKENAEEDEESDTEEESEDKEPESLEEESTSAESSEDSEEKQE